MDMYNPKQTAGTEERGLCSAKKTVWRVINYGSYEHERKKIYQVKRIYSMKQTLALQVVVENAPRKGRSTEGVGLFSTRAI